MTGQCRAEHEGFGQVIVCDQADGHCGPHGGAGEHPIVGAAWCDLPCRGRDCGGPCTEVEARARSVE